MLKRLIVLLICLLMAIPAHAEEAPKLPGLFAIENMLPEDTAYPVYTGPGKAYHVAAKGKAKVSTDGLILCYGRVADTNWLLIRYSISSDQARIGYIDAYDQLTLHGSLRELTLAAIPFSLPEAVDITDDPGSAKSLGTVSGEITLLAREYDAGGLNWAYVEGKLDKTGEPVRGFIPLTKLNGAAPLPDMPLSPFAGDRFNVTAEYKLNLPKKASADGMALYPLPDGTHLIAYRCGNDGKLYMRVISEKGKKLWAKSVPELYYSQIVLTESGFICQTFDNSEIDSGMQYTYSCKGRKWESRKVKWVEEPDRFYADNTAHFTLRRYPFCEGSVLRFALRCNTSGAEAEHLMSIQYGFAPFLCEADGKLLLLSANEHNAYVLRIYGEEAEELLSLPVPADMPAQNMFSTADHARNAVYFFSGVGRDWQLWRLDRETLTFDAQPVTIAVPQRCTLTALGVNASGTHDILMKTDLGSYLCQLEADGTLLLHQSLPGNAAWVTQQTDGKFLLILQNSDGEFVLQHYIIAEG